MDSLEALLYGIINRWNIPPERVVGHSDIAVGRKIDPGKRFDWMRLARQELAIALAVGKPQPVDPVLFCTHLCCAGYADRSLELLLPAFRLRHRQGGVGPLDGVDMALAATLAQTYPVVDPNLENA